MPRLEFDRDGVEHFAGAAEPQRAALEAALAGLPVGQAGLRISRLEALAPLLASGGPIGGVAAGLLGRTCRPVRAIVFDKTPEVNWALGWHQDRTICVAERRDMEGFGPWTVKSGLPHVEPPFDYLEEMVTLRVHLDDVPETNAPLMVAKGSHRRGRITEDLIDAIVEASEIEICIAAAGDIWLYATPILHASDAAARPARRRVLQLDYSARDLPGGLQRLGV